MVEDFVEYLNRNLRGETPSTYYKRFAKIVKRMTEIEILSVNPCKNVRCISKGPIKSKDSLTVEEITLLLNTVIDKQSKEICNAFIFSLFTSMRFCDVKDLKYKNIDFANKMLTFNQNKTKDRSSKSKVNMDIKDGLLEFTGIGQTIYDNQANVFYLPSHATCNKHIQKWVTDAGVDKHITWHSARHSFAINLIDAGVNIVTVKELMGHSSLKYTEVYARALDNRKREAINALPNISSIVA